MEDKHECACNDATYKLQGLPITTKMAIHKMLHVLPDSNTAVVYDESRENKQMNRPFKSQHKQKKLHVINYQHNNKNNTLEDSHTGLYEWVQLHDGEDINNMLVNMDETTVIKHAIKLERVRVVIATKRMLELMRHKDLQE